MTPSTLLRLAWLASPSLPVGGFSYSEGLESAVDHGAVVDEAGAGDWLLTQLQLQGARSDLAAAGHAHAAWLAGDAARIDALNAWLIHTRDGSEARQQTAQTGRSLTDWLRNSRDRTDSRIASLAALQPAPTWPVGFALAALLAGADARQALLAMAFGWAENMAQAAMKTVPLGQAAAQRMLERLLTAIPAAVDTALGTADGERQAFAPRLAILAAQHETQYSRLFRS